MSIIIIILLLTSFWSLSSIHLMSFLLSITLSASSLTLCAYFPNHSLVILLMTSFCLTASIPLPGPLDMLVAVITIAVNIVSRISNPKDILISSTIEMVLKSHIPCSLNYFLPFWHISDHLEFQWISSSFLQTKITLLMRNGTLLIIDYLCHYWL